MSSGVKMDWIMDDRVDPRAKISLARMSVSSGVMSEAHRHTNCSKTIYLEQGVIRQRIDDRWIDMTVGDTCVIEPYQVHQTENVGEDLASMLIVYSAGSRVYESVE